MAEIVYHASLVGYHLCIPALLVGVRLGYVRCIRGVVIPRSSCSRHCSRYRFSFCGHIGPSPCLVLGSYPYNPLTCIIFYVSHSVVKRKSDSLGFTTA